MTPLTDDELQAILAAGDTRFASMASELLEARKRQRRFRELMLQRWHTSEDEAELMALSRTTPSEG